MIKKDFAKFYQENLNKIYRFVFFRVGGNKSLAEDLTSEIFLKALKNFESFDPQKSRSAWLFTIVHNHLANHFRDTGKRVEVSLEEVTDGFRLEIDAKQTVSESQADGLEQILKKDAQRELWQALSRLQARERQFVTLKHLLGYSYAEIGQMAGISAGAARVATYRAFKELAKILKKK